jgi:ABC-type polysaccharide/polyol phosphate transport system ATPase subunit
LLKIIANVLKPDSGIVYTKGIILPLLELGVGFNPELTGIENIFLNGALLGIPKEKIKAQLKDIIEFSELGKFIELKLKYYSSGMIARLAFSIATIHEPDIILIDEVLSVGDSIFQEKCVKKIMKFKNNNKTIVFVSHDPNLIKMICNRLIVVNNGSIVFDGDVDQGLVFYNDLLRDIKSKNLELSAEFFEKNLKEEDNKSKEKSNRKEKVGKIEEYKKENGKVKRKTINIKEQRNIKIEEKISKSAKNLERAKELIEKIIKKELNEKFALKELMLITKELDDSEIQRFYKELNSFAGKFNMEERFKILDILGKLMSIIK